jgi:hypothetical protein
VKNTKFLLLSMILAASFIIYPLILSPAISNTSKSKQFELSETVKDVFDARANAIVKESAGKKVLSGYDTSEKLGKWALSHEKAKMDYVRLWEKKRGIKFTEARSEIQIPWSEIKGNHAGSGAIILDGTEEIR